MRTSGIKSGQNDVTAGETALRTVSFTIPALPPSSNTLYAPEVRHGRFIKMRLSDAGRQWKSSGHHFVPRFEIADTSLLRIDYTVFYSWFHRNGKRRRVDASNFMKLLHDCIAEKLGIDDSRVSEGSFASVNDANERVEVVLTELIHGNV